MKHHHSQTALLFVAVSITLFVYGIFVYMYQMVDVSLAKALAARDEVKQEQAFKDQGKTLEKIYEATASDRAKLSSFFVDDDNKVSFIEMIESLGGQTGSIVSLGSISADDLSASSPGTQGHIVARVEVQGSWSAVMGTLVRAENLPYKSIVSTVRLDSVGISDSKSSMNGWRLSFLLDTASIRKSQ